MERLIAIVGPTAVGKTRVSVDLARMLSSEVVSGDSMLVYRGLDIGTAKPDPAERAGICHHLIDILPPTAEFSVVDFQARAAAIITAVNSHSRIPILAGGTGLYVKALLEGYSFNTVPGDDAIRAELGTLADRHGSRHLHAMLQQVAPDLAATLHPNDRRRIIRALEVYQTSGESLSRRRSELVYDAAVIGLTMPRQLLYARIDQRVDAMFAAGLVDEVSDLLARGVSPAAQAIQGIGYKEIVAYLRGETDLTAAAAAIKQATRNFAKRQLTWFKKMPYIQWVDVSTFADHDKMLAYIYRLIAGKFALE
jgi:tRNA dimethylallyltransferase